MIGLAELVPLFIGVIAGALMLLAYFMMKKRQLLQTKQASHRLLKKAREAVEQERREAMLDLKNEIYKKRSDFELEMKKARVELQRLQNKHQKKY